MAEILTSNGLAQRSELPILIIGSGSTGLALAQGLRKVGIKCTIFEKQPDQARERDWNMGLHWGAPVLKSLVPDEKWARLQSVQVDPHVPTKDLDTLTFLHGATGQPLTAFQLGPFYRLRRSKLRELMSEGLDIQYNKHLSNITYAEDGQSVTAYFSDGTSATGRLLVGADGARSTTRRLLLGPEQAAIRRLPYAATFVHMKFSREKALFLRKFHPLYLATAHPENRFGFFGMQYAEKEDDPTTWTFFYYISWHCSLEEQDATMNWTNRQRLAQQKEFAKSFCDPWKSAYEWAPDDAPVWYMGLTEWDPGAEGHKWDNHGGMITMVGDAVHPMTYQRGQGLNHSITDAGQLRDVIVQLKEGGNQKELITKFEEEMIGRSGEEVRGSSTNTGMLHDWEKVMESPVFTKGLNKNQES
ncbi:FAD/NAD(P)-binding domain-containing protein [Delitschia confertaspora ATCC 74209]|uniref:FAD/NAD(P)-binding domain-containing protein n=1 Tax=Delitschia confertaspora ATCC 74209 TaxID=1513339 RepID=A0A9P4MQI9_9PLEO|nr:FAD/NAD(P)-binding domain-containing protein [Delitschia confertaspora ATCC 74209]